MIDALLRLPAAAFAAVVVGGSLLVLGGAGAALGVVLATVVRAL